MLYNPEKTHDVQRAVERMRFFISKKKVFELKEKRPTRSNPQNRYLHLILSYYALEYGETLEYVKQEVFKKYVNKSIFEYQRINPKTGEVRMEFKSSANIDTTEMTMAINRFRDFAMKQAGLYLPEPKDLAFLQEMEIQISNNQHYL